MGLPYRLSQRFPNIHSILYTVISLFFISIRNKEPWKNYALSNLKKHKRYKKIFLILGSGESINKISDDFWAWASKNTTTIAVGDWWYHDFVPDIYTTECEDQKQEARYKSWLYQINKKKEAYSNTIFLPKTYKKKDLINNMGLGDEYSDLLKQFRYPDWYKAPAGSVLTFKFFCSKIFSKIKLLGINYIPSLRSNIVFASFLAKELGAEKVILVGVDGYGGYFYNKYLSKDELKMRPELIRKIQRGSDEKHGLPTIPQIMKYLNEYIIPVNYLGKSLLEGYIQKFEY